MNDTLMLTFENIENGVTVADGGNLPFMRTVGLCVVLVTVIAFVGRFVFQTFSRYVDDDRERVDQECVSGEVFSRRYSERGVDLING
ncbi:hypothetical protein MAR_006173 [Mya arenaria]|uniref:Uncharacterized protein n=1 Tax=Mya arenaria TaxID=6604 RepID=A0ABY7D7R5_MYAAR|nr:hypothetical protein MAR_006173 [Mya arenaria]